MENLVVESDNLMPNVVEFGSDNYLRWGRKKISSKRDNKIMLSVSGIQADLRGKSDSTCTNTARANCILQMSVTTSTRNKDSLP